MNVTRRVTATSHRCRRCGRRYVSLRAAGQHPAGYCGRCASAVLAAQAQGLAA